MVYSKEHFHCDEQRSVESALRVVVRSTAQDVYLFCDLALIAKY